MFNLLYDGDFWELFLLEFDKYIFINIIVDILVCNNSGCIGMSDV